MTNRIALWLGILISCAVIADLFFFGSDHVIYLGKKFYELIEWLAFWR